jgi:outer membrane protein assembly factor BamB
LNKIRTPRVWVFSIFILGGLLLTACDGGGNESWAGLSGDPQGELLVVSFNKEVVSLNIETEDEWEYTSEDGDARFYAPPLVTNEMVYVGDYQGSVHAIRREDGKAAWVYEPERTIVLGFHLGSSDRIIAPIAQGGDTLFIGNEHGVFSLNVEAGEPEKGWEFETEHSVWAQPLYVNNPELGPPTLFVASLDQRLYALDPENGEERWSVNLDGAIVGQPTLDVEHGRLYVGTLNYKLFALNFTDGEKIAEYKTEGWVWDSPLLYNSKLYFGDLSGWLYELEVTPDGFGEVWKTDLADGALRAAPVIVDNVLVVASEDEKVYAINLDEEKSRKWEKNIGVPAIAGMAVLTRENETFIMVGTKDEEKLVVVLAVSDGDEVANFKYED